MAKLSDVESTKYEKVLVCGNSGTGKTVFSIGFPKPLYCFDFDNKITSAANFYRGESWLQDVDYDTYQKQSHADDPSERMDKKLSDLLTLFSKGERPFETIVLDSLTTMSENVMNYLIKKNPGIKRMTINKAQVPGLQDYGVFKTYMRELITKVLAFPCNVVFTAHLETKRDDTSGRLIQRPLMTLPDRDWETP